MSATTLTSVFKKILGKCADIKAIVITTQDGMELISEVKGTSEDSPVVPNISLYFSNAIDQASHLDLGSCDYTLTWSSGGIILQSPIDTVIITMYFDDGANIGLIEEYLEQIRHLLLPICAQFQSD